jgi:hypothetical protein
MSMPGFRAEQSLGKTIGVYRVASFGKLCAMNRVQPSQVFPALGECAIVCGLCVAAVLDGIPGDEVPACILCYAVYGHSA